MSNLTTLEYFGINNRRTSVHAARTMMCDEMQLLLRDLVDTKDISLQQINKLIVKENTLNKKTAKAAEITFDKLKLLYGLDTTIPLFRILLTLYRKDASALNQLLLILAYQRDSTFASVLDEFLSLPVNRIVEADDIFDIIERIFPGRYRENTARSVSRNIMSSLTQVGLVGTDDGTRCRKSIAPHPLALAYALLVGYLRGNRGLGLFSTPFVRLLDASPEAALSLAHQASALGLISFKKMGNIVEVQFRNLLNEKDQEKLNEQN